MGTPREPRRFEKSADYSRKATRPPTNRYLRLEELPRPAGKEGNGRKPGGFPPVRNLPAACNARERVACWASFFPACEAAQKTTPACAGVVRDILVLESLVERGGYYASRAVLSCIAVVSLQQPRARNGGPDPAVPIPRAGVWTPSCSAASSPPCSTGAHRRPDRRVAAAGSG
jgi:hypothetical protein